MNEDNWDNTTIRNNFTGIMIDCKIMRKADLEDKYSKFEEKFPALYKMALSSVIEGTVQKNTILLEKILGTIKNVQQGNMTTKVAELKAADEFGKEFIYPLTGKPTQEDYKRAMNEIKNITGQTL